MVARRSLVESPQDCDMQAWVMQPRRTGIDQTVDQKATHIPYAVIFIDMASSFETNLWKVDVMSF